MPKTRIPPQPAELDGMLEHDLGFEFNRYLLTLDLWNGKREQFRPVIDLLRESCLIHFRLLMEFFFPRIDPKKATKFRDIFVTDYLPEDKKLWTRELSILIDPWPDWVEKYREKADRQLAHITLDRIDIHKRGDKPWSEGPLREMARIIRVFIDNLPGDRRQRYERCRWPKRLIVSHQARMP